MKTPALCRCCSLPRESFGLPPLRSPIPLADLPVLHSRQSARAKLVLDFNGRQVGSWGSYTGVSTPAFDFVDDASTVTQIWQRVADHYDDFDLDVTTVDDGDETDGKTAVISIGGDWSNWYGTPAGGVAYVAGFAFATPNVGFVFSRSLGNNIKYIAEAAAHEGGHLFDLQHQSLWSNGVFQSEYNPGDANFAPIMGTSYYAANSGWIIGPTNFGPMALQDDEKIISSSFNGFGYRPVGFKLQLPVAPYSGRLKIKVNGVETSILTVKGQTEVANLMARKRDQVSAEFVYVNGALESLIPSTAITTL